jgi:hypothetical protein
MEGTCGDLKLFYKNNAESFQEKEKQKIRFHK